MKKFLIVIVIVLIIFTSYFCYSKQFLNYFYGKNIFNIIYYKSDDKNINFQSINNINDLINFGKNNFSFEISKSDFKLNNFINFFDANIIDSYSVNKIFVREFYIKGIDNFVIKNNQKVNVQIVEYDNSFKIGVPLILDSF